MTIHQMIDKAYKFFLENAMTSAERQKILRQYCIEELGIRESQVEQFIKDLERKKAGRQDGKAFRRFYTWYYINYVIKDEATDTSQPNSPVSH